MKETIPKIKTVIAFLRFKGWNIIDKSNGYYTLTPPDDIEPQTIKYKIPYYEKELTYPLLIRERVKEIADLYDWSRQDLTQLLSKKTIEIDTALKKFILLEETQAKAS